MANLKKFENPKKILFRTEESTKTRIENALVAGQSVNDFINGSVLLQLSVQENIKKHSMEN